MDLADEIISENAYYKAERKLWDTTWQEIADYVNPRSSNILTKYAEGEIRTEHIFDNTAEESNNVLASGQLSYICPPNEIWFKYEAIGEENKKDDDLVRFFDKLSETAFSLLGSSNFYLETHEALIDRGSFGVCCLFLEYDPSLDNPFIFKQVPVGTFCIAENKHGIIDIVSREMKMTARQIVQMFGEENVGDEIRKLNSSSLPSDQNKKLCVIHLCKPNPKWSYLTQTEEKRYSSYYVCEEYKIVLSKGGYNDFPYFVSRFLKSHDETYGRSPAMSAMPIIRSINHIRRDLEIAIEKSVNPPILASDEDSHEIDNGAGRITYWDTRNPNNRPQEWQTTARIDYAQAYIEMLAKGIEKTFFVDMFNMFQNTPPHVTATQVMEMASEKMNMFSPTFARLVEEILNPLLKRFFILIIENGHVENMPIRVEEILNFKINYISKISLAIKALQNRSYQMTLQTLEPLFPIAPELKDILDLDETVRNVFRNYGLPVDWTNSKAEVAEIRKQRQAQQEAMMKAEQMQQQTMAMNNATQAIKNIRQ